MIIRIPENFTDYYNFPFCLNKEAKVESVYITSMNPKLHSNSDINNMNNNKIDDGFAEILETEIKKYR